MTTMDQDDIQDYKEYMLAIVERMEHASSVDAQNTLNDMPDIQRKSLLLIACEYGATECVQHFLDSPHISQELFDEGMNFAVVSEQQSVTPFLEHFLSNPPATYEISFSSLLEYAVSSRDRKKIEIIHQHCSSEMVTHLLERTRAGINLGLFRDELEFLQQLEQVRSDHHALTQEVGTLGTRGMSRKI